MEEIRMHGMQNFPIGQIASGARLGQRPDSIDTSSRSHHAEHGISEL